MMKKNILLILTFLIFLIFSLFIFFLFQRSRSSNSSLNKETNFFPSNTPFSPSPLIKNKDQDLPPHLFTGAIEPTMTDKEKEEIDKGYELRQRLPLKTPSFTLDFDYDEFFFVVYLNEPKEKNKDDFNRWLKENYPMLDINQFVFK